MKSQFGKCNNEIYFRKKNQLIIFLSRHRKSTWRRYPR